MARSEKEFTKTTDGILRGLSAAKASGAQCCAYLYLARWHHTVKGDPFMCWVSAKSGADVTGTDIGTFSRALRGLCSKTFRTQNGEDVPVLSRISGGHNGASAVYRDNLYACLVGGRVGGQPCTPTNISRSAKLPTYSTDVENRVGEQIEHSRWANLPELVGKSAHPIEVEIEEDKESYDSLSSYPSQYMENGSLDGEGAAPRPNDGAARQSDEPTPEEQEAEARPKDPDLEREAEAHAAEIRRVHLRLMKGVRLDFQDMEIHAKYQGTETYKRIGKELRRNGNGEGTRSDG